MVPRLLPALITPFDEAGDVDLEAHRYNLSVLWDRGVRGFLIGGSTGEGPYLEPGERHLLVKAARKAFGRKAHLIGGVSAETQRQALAMIDEVATAKADAVLVLTPTTLTRNSLLNVEAFYSDLADRSPLPLMLYSVPAVTAFELPDESVIRLAQHPRIVGIKDSGGHPVRLQRILASVPDDFMVFTGSTQAVTLAMTAGAHGAITASTNYLPEKVLQTVQAARRQPIKARQLQQEISRISMAVEALGIPGVKAAAQAAGLRSGHPRLPLKALGPSEASDLAALLPPG
ncbi:MAG: dihydrodipicolinate synthase family protein [Actinomycetota bacterium]